MISSSYLNFDKGYDFADILPLFGKFDTSQSIPGTDFYNFGIGDIGHVAGLDKILLACGSELSGIIHRLSSLLPGMQGHGALCERLSVLIQEETGLFTQKEDIIVTDGGCDGISAATISICEPGHGIAYAVPSFPYWCILKGTGVQQFPLLFNSPEDYQLHFGSKIIGLLRNNHNIRAIILNEPQNPMGVALSKEELFALGNYVNDHNLMVIIDDVGRGLVDLEEKWWGTYLPEDKIVIVDSFTKRFASPGLRLGFVRAPRHLIKPLRGWIANLRGGVSNLNSHLGFLLVRELERSRMLYIVRDEIKPRLKQLREGLAHLPFDQAGVFPPTWGIYCLLNFIDLKKERGISGRDIVKALRKKNVVVMDDRFLFPPEINTVDRDSYIRLSVGGEHRVTEGMIKFNQVLSDLATH